MANFIIQFPLKTKIYQEHILDKRLEIGRHIYNALVTKTQKRYKEMIKTKRYRELFSQLSVDKEKNKIIWKQINNIRKEYRLSGKYDFYEDVKHFQHHYKNNIDARTAQKIADNLWKSYEKFYFSDGKEIHYKKYGTLNSLESNDNKTGIRFKNNCVYWLGLEIPVVIDYNNIYEYQAMESEIAYCRIVRKYIHNKNKYYVQLVMRGTYPIKFDNETGEIKHYLGDGDVGIDIGTSTIAIASDKDVKILELADKVRNIENDKRLLLRKLDRSRRTTNPDNYNPDGTIKKQGNKKITWIKSKHYVKYQNQLRELYRKQADIRKYQHECLANEILKLGNNIYVEDMNFKGLQKRSKKTEKNDKGQFKKKKRFGKSLGNRAPAMLLTIIDRKLQYHNSKLIKINTWEARASQFNHFDETYKKKKLSQRWNDFNGIKVQRDMYSAFLIMNIKDNLKEFDIDKCNTRFDKFKILHDLEVERLTCNKNLSSIAI